MTTKIKILIIGDPQTGKTTLYKRMMQAEKEAKTKVTLQVDIFEVTKTLEGKEYLIEVVDFPPRLLAGQTKSRFFLGASAAIILYDISKPETFRHVPHWYDELSNYSGYGKIPVYILGNKSDLRERTQKALNPIDAHILINRMNRAITRERITNIHDEISAKDGRGISAILDKLVKNVIAWSEKK